MTTSQQYTASSDAVQALLFVWNGMPLSAGDTDNTVAETSAKVQLISAWVPDGIALIIVASRHITEIECFSLALWFLGKIRNLTRHQYPQSRLRWLFGLAPGLDKHLSYSKIDSDMNVYLLIIKGGDAMGIDPFLQLSI